MSTGTSRNRLTYSNPHYILPAYFNLHTQTSCFSTTFPNKTIHFTCYLCLHLCYSCLVPSLTSFSSAVVTPPCFITSLIINTIGKLSRVPEIHLIFRPKTLLERGSTYQNGSFMTCCNKWRAIQALPCMSIVCLSKALHCHPRTLSVPLDPTAIMQKPLLMATALHKEAVSKYGLSWYKFAWQLFACQPPHMLQLRREFVTMRL